MSLREIDLKRTSRITYIKTVRAICTLLGELMCIKEVSRRTPVQDRRMDSPGTAAQEDRNRILVTASIRLILRAALTVSVIYTQTTYPQMPNRGTRVRTRMRLGKGSDVPSGFSAVIYAHAKCV